MSTVYDLARVAGVSAATVSRIISRSVLVDQDPRERMLGMFCYVTGPKDVPDARERQAAFVEAVLAGHDRIIQRVRSRQLFRGQRHCGRPGNARPRIDARCHRARQ